MNIKYTYIYAAALVFFVLMALSCGPGHQKISMKAEYTDTLPMIDPDYADTVIPPNIAPMNFRIQMPAKEYYVKIYSAGKDTIYIHSTSHKIMIPFKPWKNLLDENRGKKIFTQIYLKNDSNLWVEYRLITNQIANEEIDSHLAYRLLNPAYKYWKKMGIYQRDLESYKQKPVLVNKMTDGNCMNCHNFCFNSSDKMIFHMRAGKGSGMMLYNEGKVTKVNTATKFSNAGAYPSWHPNGNLIALSVNKLKMFYHAVNEPRDVMDFKSDLIVYNVAENMVTSSLKIADPEYMETFPCWGANGKYLYFCRSPKFEDYISSTAEGDDLAYDKIIYDLVRVPYDETTGVWGEAEVLISAKDAGFSVVLPRVSPNGKYLMFTVSQYGSFPIYHSFSDLYIMDLNTLQYRKMTINSDKTDSFHSWSNNSRWFVFTSKRRDEVCSRPFFSYFDEFGQESKPFILPQKDPDFYDTFFNTFNVPEIFQGPFKVSPRKLVNAAYSKKAALNASLDPAVIVKEKKEVEQPIYQSVKN